jgi:hypothetical protein
MVGMRRWLLGLVAMVALAAAGCGGGSDHRHFEPWQAEGLWSGTTSSGTLDGVILDTGEYWLIYGSAGVARSVVHGNGFFSGGRFVSDDGADYVFGYDRPFFTSLAARVEPEYSIDGEIYLENRLEGFSMGYVPDYQFPANPAAIVGQWRGSGSTLLSAGDFFINIDAQGSFTAGLAGSCEYAGRIMPNRNGRNVFDIALTSLATCPFLFSANGVLVATGGRLVITAVTPDRRDVFYAVAQ